MILAFLLFFGWWLIAFIPPVIIDKCPKHLKGMAVAPFILLTDRQLGRLERLMLLRHEKEHIRQQRKYSPVLFLIIYCTEYLIYRAKGMNHFQAYWNISFEKQAREAERIG